MKVAKFVHNANHPSLLAYFLVGGTPSNSVQFYKFLKVHCPVNSFNGV